MAFTVLQRMWQLISATVSNCQPKFAMHLKLHTYWFLLRLVFCHIIQMTSVYGLFHLAEICVCVQTFNKKNHFLSKDRLWKLQLLFILIMSSLGGKIEQPRKISPNTCCLADLWKWTTRSVPDVDFNALNNKSAKGEQFL